MIARQRLAGIVIAVASAATVSLCLAATNPPRLDPRDESISTPGTPGRGIEVSPTAEPPVSGNPLWAIPLGSLTATRERPIFLPSRRPPAVAAAPVEPPKSAPPPAEPERPALRLLGIVTGTTEGFAIFISDTTRNIIRLKTGEGHEGWILRSVKAREAVLEKNRRSAVIELPHL
jgi:general secretion pathway protein N